jgi:hypothetical protein
MDFHHPVESGLDEAFGLRVATLDRLDLHPGGEEGSLEQADRIVNQAIGQANAGIGRSIPGEWLLAQGGGVLAAILALTSPQAKAGIEVIGLPPEVIGGISFSLIQIGDKAGDFGASHGREAIRL